MPSRAHARRPAVELEQTAPAGRRPRCTARVTIDGSMPPLVSHMTATSAPASQRGGRDRGGVRPGRTGSRRRSAHSRGRRADPRCGRTPRCRAPWPGSPRGWSAAPARRAARRTSRPGRPTGVSASSSARTCGSVLDREIGPAGRPERDQERVFERRVRSGHARKNSVSLGMAPGPAALDEADAQLVEQAGHRELVDHRVGDALALGTVAQRGVEDLVRHWWFLPASGTAVLLMRRHTTKRPPADAGGLRAQGSVRALADNRQEPASKLRRGWKCLTFGILPRTVTTWCRIST